MAKLRTLSILLSLLVPAHATRSPDCGGILTPSGLSYLAEVSKPHTEAVLRQDLTAPAPPDLFLGSPEPSSRNQINSVRVTELSLSLVPDSGLRLSIDVDLGITPAPSTTKVMRLSILADLHLEMNPEGNLELVTSACKTTVEEMQSTEEVESKSSSSDADKEINIGKTTFQVAGVAIPLPVSPVPFSMPEPVSSSPSHLTLAFSEHFYTSLFFALELAGAFNMTIPDMSAGLLLRVADTRMMISAAAIEDIELSLAASDVGPVPAALLEELFLPPIREEVPAQMNVVLSGGVFLPHIASFTYTDVNVVIHKDYVLVPCNLELQERVVG